MEAFSGQSSSFQFATLEEVAKAEGKARGLFVCPLGNSEVDYSVLVVVPRGLECAVGAQVLTDGGCNN